MVLVVGLSLWIVFGGFMRTHTPAPGATTFELVVTNRKVLVEQIQIGEDPDNPQYEYRFLNWDEVGAKPLSERQFQGTLAQKGGRTERPWIMRFFNVSSYTNMLWIGVGLGGQLLFSGRMVLQWLVSEQKRQSIVPPSFWYMSLAGGVALTAYFIWRHDPIGVLGQSIGLVIYVRNIRLIQVPQKLARAHTLPPPT
jgi:lipid-A-disaccharide synthase-like uncharacterized protein